MNVLIVGTGTIGKPLINLFLKQRDELRISQIIFHKNKPEIKCRGMLEDFIKGGAHLAVYGERFEEFKKLLEPRNLAPSYTFKEALEKSEVVIDCTDKGIARKLKEQYYGDYSDKFFIAQGSENGFGKPYAFSVNDQALKPGEDRFIQVVSCNTHQVLCLLKTVALDPDNRGEWRKDNLVRARFYLARRGADVSQDDITIGPEVGIPDHYDYHGSHQGADAMRVLATIDPEILDIHTVADTFDNPYMHVVNFEITLKEKTAARDIENRFRFNPLTAVTYETRANRVFSDGRDRGEYGRILNQTVVCLPSLQVVRDGYEIHGRCFTPQDGNALLSSIAALLWFKYPENYKQILKEHFFKRPFLFDEV